MWRYVLWLKEISTLKKDAAISFEGLVLIYQTTRRYIREDRLSIINIIIVFCGLTEMSVFKTLRHITGIIIIIIIIITIIIIILNLSSPITY